MNNILISNPFLSRPPSPFESLSSQEVESQENFLTYQATEFEKAWEQIKETSEEGTSNNPLIYDSSEESDSGISTTTSFSPETISTFAQFLLPEESDSMDTHWLSQEGFTFDQLNAIPPASAEESNTNSVPTLAATSPDPAGALFYKDYLGDYYLPDEMDFDELNDIFNDRKKPLMNDKMMTEAPSTMTSTAPSATVTSASDAPIFNKNHIDNLPDISLSSILAPSSSSYANNNYTVAVANIQGESQSQQNVYKPYNTRATHQRKAAPGTRVVAPSPAYHLPSSQESDDAKVKDDDPNDMDYDVKPNIAALGVNNGQTRGRKRSMSTRSISNDTRAMTPSGKGHNQGQGGSSSSKKPRKYEINDPNDPSVRNAIAAKMNRDRKKKEFELMKERAEAAESRVESLEDRVSVLEGENADLRSTVRDQRQKMATSTGLNRHLTTMKKAFEAICPALSASFGRPMSLQVPDSFDSIPAVVDENGALVSDLNPEGFNILDEGYQMGAEGQSQGSDGSSSEFFTLHINPNAGKIRLDYDPSFQ